MKIALALGLLLFVGALSGKRTLLHSFAVAFDAFVQGIVYDDPSCITLSSRAGLAARSGNTKWARLIGFAFFNAQHCEQAIVADLSRAQETLRILS